MSKSTKIARQIQPITCPSWCTTRHDDPATDGPHRRYLGSGLNELPDHPERYHTDCLPAVAIWQNTSRTGEFHEPMIDLSVTGETSGFVNLDWLTPSEARRIATTLLIAADTIESELPS